MKEEDIDLSDIPEQSHLGSWNRLASSAVLWASSRREALKEKLPLVDDEVIEFFQQAGDNPADRMNAVLRAYAQTHRKTA